MAARRAHVIFSGFVQGVGFRFTAQMLARRFQVSGWVRNLPGGTVELEAQGEEPEVNQYLERLRSEMDSHVSRADVSWIPAIEGEREFSVCF